MFPARRNQVAFFIVEDPMANQFIIVAVTDGVMTITLNRPEVLNSFTVAMAQEVVAAVRAAGSDPAVRAVLLTGNGRGFCAGQDLAEAVPQDGSAMPDIGDIVRSSYNPLILSIRSLEKPVICAVNGVAAGDITIASDDATFVESFARLGLIPDTSGTFFIPRLVGTQRATGMMFLAEKLTAAKAKEWGLIWDTAPSAELMERADTLAKTLATQATRGFGLTKRAVNRSLSSDLESQLAFEAEMMSAAGRTDDYKEGVNAFLQKRKPHYVGH
jgi:2-(1,2-epoxy-1,2-dihydrophenyl)acetyl-CoA isomerase